MYGLSGGSTYDPNYPKMLMEFATAYPYSSFVGFAVYIGIPRNMVHAWAKKHEQFARAKQMATDIFETYWANLGHTGTTRKNFQGGVWSFNMKARFSWNDQGPPDRDNEELEWDYD
jgi:hypothetical protein